VRTVVLAGGVGGGRFARAVVESVPPADVTVVGNVGDDLEVLGLHVSPDLDSVLYTLAGVFDHERGWGRAGETWNVIDEIAGLGHVSWFKIGDRDLALHVIRTKALRRGEPLSAITQRLAAAFGVEAQLLPVTDDRLRTRVETAEGWLPFQDWFVKRGHRDPVEAVGFDGAEESRPAPGVLEALEQADLILIAPSNPYVSIGPILAVREVRAAIERRRCPAVAVSPLIGGKTVKGPADVMLARLAGGTTAGHVAGVYKGMIDVLVFDEVDADDAEGVSERGVRPVVTRTLMRDAEARRRLAEAALGVAAPSR
jgi:LPPG:FO 2-phospho-L-lactate transferase